MKQIIFIFLIILTNSVIWATDVSGDQFGIWDLEGSPYNIVGDITVPTGGTLTIEGAVEVIAMGNYKISALGNIIAEASANDTIRFHGYEGLVWGGIRLEDETNPTYFDHCRISNTDDINDSGIHSVNSPVYINHSLIDGHQKGVSFSGLSSDEPAYMEIKNSKISNIIKSGITVVDNSNVLVDSCEITQCGLGASFYGAIQLSLQSNSHSCNPTLTHNYIHHNDKQGITLANLFGYNNMAPTVSYNDICYNFTGVYLYAGKGTYKGNNIHHNFEENNADSGAGVMLYGSAAEAIFTYNSIHHNYTGFYLASEATVNLGDLNNTITDDDGYNCIYDNIFFDGTEYSVYNASSADVSAENNVWDNDPPLDETIIDGNDNVAYGFVDYEPTLSPFAPPFDITVDTTNFTISAGDPAYPTYGDRVSWNLYQDGVLLNSEINQPFVVFEPVYGAEITYGVSYNYENPIGESVIKDLTILIPHILTPPQNPNATSSGYITWDEPEEGSTSDFLHYNIYLDGVLDGTPTETFYQLEGLVNGQVYYIGLSAEYLAGESEILEFELSIVSSNDDIIKINETLYNYPNPFKPSGAGRGHGTTISFTLNEQYTQNAHIEIYNLKGQKIKTISIEQLSNIQEYDVIWNGKDESDKNISSGIYFYKLLLDGKDIRTRKMLLLK
ncbi:MAG: right-handed parallel beta-helix repeat-containing protein [Candidatus Cloacimonetes bacterium]|nr:right-handed parallel beta-helix repeat-containing protein [Candidatus Cloacimonadota bacterium]